MACSMQHSIQYLLYLVLEYWDLKKVFPPNPTSNVHVKTSYQQSYLFETKIIFVITIFICFIKHFEVIKPSFYDLLIVIIVQANF